ncbi:hypothetical protein ACFOZ7_16815 [Natribaculum luteum]|uniref:Halobacterial output domain-containing protein n=1 Tax=Natribaculum luteum TaxID=1586232 RepID=A0ABD5P2N5_9EURY|nr:hypothetical protein [Natribaculum luteum]
MAIPGYDPADVENALLERETEGAGASASIVAAGVPDEFDLVASDLETPADALTDPVDLVGLDDVTGLDALRVVLEYDPSELPPGASPTDVAVAVETESERVVLDSAVDLEETTVSATTTERPPGQTFVAVNVENDGL